MSEEKKFILIDPNKVYALFIKSINGLKHKVDPYTNQELKELCSHFNIPVDDKTPIEIGRDLLKIIIDGYYYDAEWNKKEYHVSGTILHITIPKYRALQTLISFNWIPQYCLDKTDADVDKYLTATADDDCAEDEIKEDGKVRKITHDDIIPMILASYRNINRNEFVIELMKKSNLFEPLTKEEQKVLFDPHIRIDHAMKQVALKKLLTFGV